MAMIISSFPILSGSSAGYEPNTLPNPISNLVDDDENGNHTENRIALIDTSYGIITIELYERRAPITTGNFINLSIDAFYDGLLFHRVIDDFVIQTGDPNTRDNNPYNDGSGGSAKTIPLEIHPELTHIDGAVGMARSTDPDSASSQFYICDGPQHGLDGDYAVFGIVIDGIDVVRKIAQVDTWGNKRPILKDHPIEDVYMYSVFITENNTEYDFTPPEEDDWFLGDTFRSPGFDAGIIICSIAFIIFLLGRKRYAKKSGR
jgi:cyclophilin family peptidyl-prolyl cis-trans isomerase